MKELKAMSDFKAGKSPRSPRSPIKSALKGDNIEYD